MLHKRNLVMITVAGLTHQQNRIKKFTTMDDWYPSDGGSSTAKITKTLIPLITKSYICQHTIS